MHPKNVFGLEVRDADITTADEAVFWLRNEHIRLFDECQAHVAAGVAAEREKLAQKKAEVLTSRMTLRR